MKRRTFIGSILAASAAPWIARADRRSALINQKPASGGGGGGGLSSGLVLLWKLDEASGDRVATVGGLNLTDSGTVGQAAGPTNLGNAAQFSGSDYLYHADDSALREGDFDSHWVCWVRDVIGGTVMLVTKDSAGSRGHIAYLVGRKLQWEGPDASSTDQLISTSLSAFSGSTWHMLDWGYDKSAGKWFVNLDAGTRDEASYSHPGTGQTSEFRLGARAYIGFEGFFQGRLCYLMRWNRILSGSELTQLYNSGNGLAYPF